MATRLLAHLHPARIGGLHARVPELGLAHDQALGIGEDRVDHASHRQHQRILRRKLGLEPADQLFSHSAIDGSQQAVLVFVDEKLEKHQHHRKHQRQSGGVEGNAQTAGHLGQ